MITDADGESLMLDLIFQPKRHFYHGYPNAMDIQVRATTFTQKELYTIYLGTVDEFGEIHNFFEAEGEYI